jgi:multiple sugar transport system permease protein
MENDIFNFPVQWIPPAFTLRNYEYVLFGKEMVYGRTQVAFTTYYYNSIKVAFFGMTGGLIVCTTSAYAFARINFWGKKVVFMMYLATLMFPGAVLLIPRFIVFRWIRLYNTHLALIFPEMISVFGIFLLRQFYLSLPNDLFDAARIDGCSHFRIFAQIATPLVTPAIAAFTVLSFVWKWNDFENPLIFLVNNKLFTLPLGIVSFKEDFQSTFGPIITASLVSMLPLFIIFLAGQKYFVEGIALTGTKA